jgi:hypothetical protein
LIPDYKPAFTRGTARSPTAFIALGAVDLDRILCE